MSLASRRSELLRTRRRKTLNAIRQAGRVVASELGLLGLFGIDLVIREDGVPVFLEINPRYTASVECIERAHGISAIDLHLRACRGEPVAVPSREPGGVGPLHCGTPGHTCSLARR